MATKLGVFALPTLLVIDKKGQVPTSSPASPTATPCAELIKKAGA